VGSAGTEIAVYRTAFNASRQPWQPRGVGIGYVLAHELAHVMQGVGRHSESGILKAQWSSDDFEEMIFHKLAFTNFDVELIHQV